MTKQLPQYAKRPSKKHESRLAQLFAALQNGIDRKNACLLAEIHETTFYRWLDNDPGFASQVSRAESCPKCIAQKLIIKAMVGQDAEYKIITKHSTKGTPYTATVKTKPYIAPNVTVAQWYLEKTMPYKYGHNPRVEDQEEQTFKVKDVEARRELLKILYEEFKDEDKRSKFLEDS